MLNNKYKFLIILTVVLIFSMIAPIYWNIFYIFDTYVISLIFGDIMGLIFLFFILAWLIFKSKKKRYGRYLILAYFIYFLIYQFYYDISISAYSNSSIENEVLTSMQLGWKVIKMGFNPKFSTIFSNHSGSFDYSNLLISFQCFGILNYFIFLVLFGYLSITVTLISTFLVEIILIIFSTTIIFIEIFNRNKHVKIFSNEISIFFMGHYSKEDLEKISKQRGK